MINKTQTNPLENFTINYDGQLVDDAFMPADPSALEIARDTVLQRLGQAVEHVKLQTRMLVFDTVHGTNYREIRNDLVEQQKRRAFEAKIGIVAIGRKKK